MLLNQEKAEPIVPLGTSDKIGTIQRRSWTNQTLVILNIVSNETTIVFDIKNSYYFLNYWKITYKTIFGSPGDLHQHFTQFVNMFGLTRFMHIFFKIIWFTSVSILWKERNDRVFKNMTSTSFMLIEKVKLTSFFWLKSKQTTFTYNYHDRWNQLLLCMGVY